MIIVDLETCRGCKICEKECPLDAIHIPEKKAVCDADKCVECGVCVRVCPFGALSRPTEVAQGLTVCTHCSVQCKIAEGHTGACKRYTNEGGELKRNRDLVPVNKKVDYTHNDKLDRPVVTATGSGTNYPCIRPAPHIVSEMRDGVEVVTVVTEAPLSYSGCTVKLDTNAYIGEEGDPVYRNNHLVGMVNTEEYGSKMIAIGGSNRLTGGKDGFEVARTICDLSNGEEVTLMVNKKIKVVCQLGKAPVIDGVEIAKMRLGCGSATIGLFARRMKEAGLDDCIVIDHHVTGLLSEHLAGKDVGYTWSGIVPNATKSTPGRYFGGHGDGIGGTVIMTPRDAIKEVDMSVAKPGIKCLVTNTTGEIRAMFEVLEGGDLKEIELTEGATSICDIIYDTCQMSVTSVIFTGGSGGSARGGVTTKPLGITEAVHDGRAHLTIGGAPAYVWPGGGINFMVDAGKVVDRSFTWVPTPAMVAPIEYTITKSDYADIGGHMDEIVPLEELKKRIKMEE